MVREMHQSKIERIGGNGEALAHHGRRNRPRMPADVRRFGEEFLGG
jgi:hypothetical protein